MAAPPAPSEEERGRAINDAGYLTELVSRLNDPDWAVSSNAAKELVSIGDPSLPALIEVLASGTSEGRRRAANALKELGNPLAIEPLIAAIDDQDSLVGWTAVHVLGDFHDPRALEILLRLLRDDSRPFRHAASDSLGRLGNLAIPDLIAALNDEDPEVRAGALGALTGALSDLSQTKDERATEPLIAVLRDPDPRMRLLAINALSHAPNGRVIRELIKLLADEDPDVRGAAVETLGDNWVAEALPELERLAASDNEMTWEGCTVAEQAKYAIEMIQYGDEALSNRHHQ